MNCGWFCFHKVWLKSLFGWEIEGFCNLPDHLERIHLIIGNVVYHYGLLGYCRKAYKVKLLADSSLLLIVKLLWNLWSCLLVQHYCWLWNICFERRKLICWLIKQGCWLWSLWYGAIKLSYLLLKAVGKVDRDWVQ